MQRARSALAVRRRGRLDRLGPSRPLGCAQLWSTARTVARLWWLRVVPAAQAIRVLATAADVLQLARLAERRPNLLVLLSAHGQAGRTRGSHDSVFRERTRRRTPACPGRIASCAAGCGFKVCVKKGTNTSAVVHTQLKVLWESPPHRSPCLLHTQPLRTPKSLPWEKGSDAVRGNKGEQEEAVAAVMAADSEKGEDAAQKHEKAMWLVAAFWR